MMSRILYIDGVATERLRWIACVTRVQLTDDRFRQWRDVGVFEALLGGPIAEAASDRVR